MALWLVRGVREVMASASKKAPSWAEPHTGAPWMRAPGDGGAGGDRREGADLDVAGGAELVGDGEQLLRGKRPHERACLMRASVARYSGIMSRANAWTWAMSSIRAAAATTERRAASCFEQPHAEASSTSALSSSAVSRRVIAMPQ